MNVDDMQRIQKIGGQLAVCLDETNMHLRNHIPVRIAELCMCSCLSFALLLWDPSVRSQNYRTEDVTHKFNAGVAKLEMYTHLFHSGTMILVSILASILCTHYTS